MAKPITQTDIEIMQRWQKSPRAFIKDIWGLVPEHDNSKFVKGKHITRQQDLILQAVENALVGKGSRRISVRSGHGIGKSTCLSWLVLWFLCCFLDAQVPCTAPTSEQMHDVLWKELARWIDKMPPWLKEKFEWSSSYIRVLERPETWFSRAKTARKEAPEALAGVHGDHVMMVVDEASGVPEEIFNTAEGALTNENVLLIIISNPTRLNGYFYDSHHVDKENWQTLAFNSEKSPIVDRSYVDRISSKHGLGSDEYRIRVLGQFPKTDMIDDKGYVPLLLPGSIHFTEDKRFLKRKRLGVDPSGQGSDVTAWVLRDGYKAMIVGEQKISDPRKIAMHTLTLMSHLKIAPEDVIIDNFGSGADVAKYIALNGFEVFTINVGDHLEEPEEGTLAAKEAETDSEFINVRAKSFWDMRRWIMAGNELIADPRWEELFNLRYRREGNNKIKIMGKLEMKKNGIKSPNFADALMLTFVQGELQVKPTKVFTSPSTQNNIYDPI